MLLGPAFVTENAEWVDKVGHDAKGRRAIMIESGKDSPVDEGCNEDVDAHDPPEEHGDEEVDSAAGVGVETRAGAGTRGVHSGSHDICPTVPRDQR